ncbi:MAG: LPXTG cell wall anchor domain-containing protein, partial [Actinomycetota bacterium]|nr:LPXTG cell wall anchor domain-containing protein [Actinomycetota bacterium]
ASGGTVPSTGAGATATGAAGAPGGPGAAGQPGGDATAAGGDGASGGQDVPQVGTALAASPAGRHAADAGSPVLLALGLAMVLGGGAFLMMRNRRSRPGPG